MKAKSRLIVKKMQLIALCVVEFCIDIFETAVHAGLIRIHVGVQVV
ncbi:hypothetical protein VCR29J2_700218 [Vibrio coralliirubri]|nr:hypothetical protein VCR29J2_700218 [Vibrio coralliirubri]